MEFGRFPGAIGKPPGDAEPSAETDGVQAELDIAEGAAVLPLAFQTPDQIRFAVPIAGKPLPLTGNSMPPKAAVLQEASADGSSAAVAPARAAIAPEAQRGVSKTGATDAGQPLEKPQEIGRIYSQVPPSIKAESAAKLAETPSDNSAKPIVSFAATGQAAAGGQASSQPNRAAQNAAAPPDDAPPDDAPAPPQPKAEALPLHAPLAKSDGKAPIVATDAAARVIHAQEVLPRVVQGKNTQTQRTETPALLPTESLENAAEPARIVGAAGESAALAQSQTNGSAPNASLSQTAAANVNQVAQPIAGPIAAPQPAISPEPRGEVRPAQTLDAIVDQLSEAREMGRAARPELTVRHQEFGAVTMRIEAMGSDLRATLSSRDPGFVPAVQAALSDRAAAIAEASPGQSPRGHEQSGNSGSNSGFQSGSSGLADRNYGSSPGSGQGSSQPYRDQSSGSENTRGRPERSGDTDGDPSAPRDTGLFA